MARAFKMHLSSFSDSACGYQVTTINPADQAGPVPDLPAPDFGHCSAPAVLGTGCDYRASACGFAAMRRRDGRFELGPGHIDRQAVGTHGQRIDS